MGGELVQFEELLLKSARNGDHKTVSEIIKAFQEGKATLDINCKGQSKCNLGWTPLHLACYFGHTECVEVLLHGGVQVDIQNDCGDTPLHKAALTNRENIVMLLLEHGASVSVVNGEGLKASDLAAKRQVKKLILGAERTEQKVREEKFIHAAREGDVQAVKKMLQDTCAPSINCTDSIGNTALHCASYRGHINVAVVLLQNGCDTSIRNAAGQTALELVQSQQMEQVLAVPPVRSFSRSASRFEGPLLRRMRIVGWRMVWSVLERGVLTFFNSRADASSGVGRRDFKYLDSAKVVPAIGGEQAVFIIQFSDGTRHRLAALPDPVHSACVNRQKWVSALEDHIKFSTHYVQHGFSIDSDDDDEDEKIIKPLGCMEDALATAKAHQEVLEQEVQEVLALISYLEEEQLKQGSVHTIIKKFNHLGSTARNMASSLSHCLSLLKQQEEVRELQLKEEKEKVRVLEESLRVLATEHHDLEESIASRLPSNSSSDGASLYNTPANSFRSLPRPRRFFPTGVPEDEFYDAFSQDDDSCTLKSVPSPCDSECSTNTLVSCMSSLPLDPQSPKSRHPNTSSSFTIVTPSLEKGLGGETYTKLTSHSSLETEGMEDHPPPGPEGMEDHPPLGLENESVVTISSGTYHPGAANATESPTLTISLTDSNHVIPAHPQGADCEGGQHQGTPSTPSPSFTPSSTPGSTPHSNCVPSSLNPDVAPIQGPASSQRDPPSGNSNPLAPETPLVRTSDLSEVEDTASGDSDTTVSSQSGDKERKGGESSSSFSLIYLGGTRYKGAHGGPKRLWRNWGRKALPSAQFQRNDFSLWSVLRQCIGKELSKITMPIVFNEPLSFLQRMSEYMEYAWLLDKADAAPDPVRRMQYVTAFALSGLASNWERLGKPFNPLLGETYELQRDQYRIVCEQVSHHPPISAFSADSEHWTFHGTIHPKLKFWGKSVEIQPKGTLTIQLPNHGEAYTWSNVNCCVHNIIVGKLWIEQYGTMEILNHATGHKSVLTFKTAGWFSKDLHRVEGFILDKNKKKQCFMYGKWTEFLRAVDIDSYNEYMKANAHKFSKREEGGRVRGNSTAGIPDEGGGKAFGGSSRRMLSKLNSITASLRMSMDMEGAAECDDGPPEEHEEGSYPRTDSTYSIDIPNSLTLWECDPRPETSSQYYHFTLFAMSLNENSEDLKRQIAPTDSRLRPDIRLLEEGDIDHAAAEKTRLEEKQRTARKARKKIKSEYKSRWFDQGQNPFTRQDDWLYCGGYWDRNYSDIPDIF